MTRRRRSFTVAEKLLRLLRTVESRTQQGDSVRIVCDELGIDPRQYRDWRRDRNKLLSTKKKKRTVHRGHSGCLTHLEEALVNWVIEWRDQGAELAYEDVVSKASELDPAFSAKSKDSKYQPHCEALLYRQLSPHSIHHPPCHPEKHLGNAN